MDRLRLRYVACLLVATTVGCAGDPRAAFDRVQTGEAQQAVERSLGATASVVWKYEKNELNLHFESGRVVGRSWTVGKDEEGTSWPVGDGQTVQQVRDALGEPKLICNLYEFKDQQEGRVCFSGGKVSLKEIVVPPLPEPIVHRWGLCSPMVFFPSGSTSLSPQAQQRLRQFLVDCPYTKQLEKGISLVVQGHTDTTGDAQANRALSIERARAVRRYLMSLGVPPALVDVEGLGDSKLLAAKGDDETTHAQNRRAEVFVRKNGEIVVIW